MNEILKDGAQFVRSHLFDLLAEIEKQTNMAAYYGAGHLSFHDEMAQIREFIEHDEYEIAYECVVVNLEKDGYSLSGIAAVKLLEVGLLMHYKTERESDHPFDFR